MCGNVLFVGLDIDDRSFHGCAIRGDGKGSQDFRVRPTASGLIIKLLDLKREFGVSEVRVCYEATYIGFTLQRAFKVFCVGTADTSRQKVSPRHIGHPIICVGWSG